MHVKTFCYRDNSGWSVDRFPSGDSERTLVILFGASKFMDSPAPIHEVTAAYPNSHLVGCSTAGEIVGSEVTDNCLIVSLVKFERTSLRTAHAPIGSSEDSFSAGRSIAERLNQPGLRAVFVLSDGLQVNGSELVRGINAVIPDSVVVTGGLAGDGDRFQRTWIIKDGTSQCGYVTAVGMYGESIRVGHGSKGGWDMFGPERCVTRSKGNVLYELDGKPALQLYKEYLGERAAGLPATGLLFPLALRSNSLDQKSLVRTILAVDEATQSMTFAGDIPQGFLAQLMRANLDRLIDGASHAALMTKNGCRETTPALAIAISCVGRRLVLGERAEEEIEAAFDGLPGGIHQIGFYSYGEISPYATGSCDLHNQTMTLTTISEL